MGALLANLYSRMIRVVAFICCVVFCLAAPEAEPTAASEADPWLLFGGHGGYLGYRGYGGYGYGLGHGYGGYYGWGRKRRSADAEPTAAADPWYGYSYGLGHGGYYGGYGHGGYLGYGGYGGYLWGRKRR